jgi:hypothetical protein
MRSFTGTAVCVLLASLILSCGSTEPDSAAFTMAATVNGGPWAPGGAGTTPPIATLYSGDNTLLLNGTQSGVSPATRGISIEVRGVTGPGTYILADTSSSGGSAVYSESSGSFANGDFTMTFYWTSASRTGHLIVTELDLAAGSLAGTFDFTAANPLSGTVSITSGTFSGHFASTPGSAHLGVSQ